MSLSLSLSRLNSNGPGCETRGPGHTPSTLDLSRSKCWRDDTRISLALRHVGEEEPCGVGQWRRRRSNGKACTCLISARLPMLNYLTVRADTHSFVAVSPISPRCTITICLSICSLHLKYTSIAFTILRLAARAKSNNFEISSESRQRIYHSKIMREKYINFFICY